jgi:ribosome-binding protein aMBF1 (putative translation factor)
LAAHFTDHAGSGNCVLCGKTTSNLWSIRRDGSIKSVRICEECHDKMTGTPNDNALFTRVMRMLD